MNQAATARQRFVDDVFVPLARHTFEQRPDIHSVMVGVAQYWCDEADDAVHCAVEYSTRHTPLFPHLCPERIWPEPEVLPPRGADFCRYCPDETVSMPNGWYSVPWDSNGGAIPTFEAYCREACHQEMGTDEAYRPFVLARRDGIEIVGRPVRPWIDPPVQVDLPPPTARYAELHERVVADLRDDGPRAVLADWLTEQADPRGELIRLQLDPSADPKRLRALLDAHWAAAVGRIHSVIARHGSVVERGFLTEAEVWFQDSEELGRVLDDPSWATVERLHFLGTDTQLLHPAMRQLRRVSGLGAAALREAASSALPTLEQLSVTCGLREVVNALNHTSAFPRLTRLEVPARSSSPSDLAALDAIAGDRSLCVVVAGAPMDALAGWLRALPDGMRLGWTRRDGVGRPAGWRFEMHHEAGQLQVTGHLDTMHDNASLQHVRDLQQAIGGDARLTLKPSRYYDPSPGDVP
ncbi:MAG: TIGR02996 domain-containing protein [Myxococcales bacterium]|nr:TIGR02996 domain-containing protein [Myxococcales bacterium]